MENSNIKRLGQGFFAHGGFIVLVTAAVFLLFSVTANGFLTAKNFFTILRSMSIVTVLAAGITFVLTLGEIDLSIQTLPALAASVLCVLMNKGMPVAAAFVISFAVCAGFGFISGLIIVKTKLPSIIITLAANMIANGLSYILTKQRAVVFSNKAFTNLFAGNIGRFPVMFLWMAVFVLLGYILLQKTKFGRNIAFIGDNREAAEFAGIHIRHTIVAAFVLCSVFSFMAGILGCAQSSNAVSGMLSENMMTAIAVTLIGGTTMAGGKGNMPGTILGAFFLTLITNGFLIMGIAQWVLYLVNGVIILATLSFRYMLQRK
ncbi:ABC transporter permease [Diplocloster agilis]|uniref:ABC transporter permease n=1 Tax=Diplocloster agilis TaxID=2850323 RepID=A0A949NCL3_9FIRM|nr:MULTISPECIES: ABC transporter permease [Lachnospiraceae]MBU9735001.1 ABC transporter permease [Diplocloster agilis]MBU9742473.1 ABC transporter permease [Diplocloster agilis]MCU6733540.1 ABC transporter permease [Suonthocola fibrivorans]SCI97793.1 Ribose transport system permease protein rbsC [uncultured Clostridium sp.]